MLYKIIFSIIVVAILALIMVNFVDFSKKEYVHANEGLTSLTDFELVYPDAGSSVKGTVFVMQGSNSLRIIITADIVVGETDIGGAAFSFPSELKVTNILCSYNGDTDGKHVGIWITKSDLEYTTFVEIARDWITRQPDPGQGTVILELQLSGNVALKDIESLDFLVSIGGKGYIIGIVHERITIPLLKDAP